MSKTVTFIPPTRDPITASPLEIKKMRKVAAYARVSTDHEEQETSFDAQVDYYTQYIQSKDDWEFVKIYTDNGVSGTGTVRRKGFQEMISDALSGKIDLIITKSLSRFARNTVDSLSTIRQLKEKGVECYFEKENIYTFDEQGELLISIMSSLSQEESRSISENVKWGIRKRMADGKVSVPYSRFLGYDRGEDGGLVINKREAKIVKYIYRLFLQGMSPYGIAKQLTREGIKTVTGRDAWHAETIRGVLKNEKYKGSALLQKQYTIDFLTKKKKENCGELPQYYIENSHEAIISPEIHDMVQTELERRYKRKTSHRSFS